MLRATEEVQVSYNILGIVLFLDIVALQSHLHLFLSFCFVQGLTHAGHVPQVSSQLIFPWIQPMGSSGRDWRWIRGKFFTPASVSCKRYSDGCVLSVTLATTGLWALGCCHCFFLVHSWLIAAVNL